MQLVEENGGKHKKRLSLKSQYQSASYHSGRFVVLCDNALLSKYISQSKSFIDYIFMFLSYNDILEPVCLTGHP